MSTITLEHVTFAYDNEDIINDVSFSIHEQKGCMMLAGENGSGKSTLLNILCGFLRPYKGNMLRENVQIAYLPFDNPLFPHLTLKENMRYFYRSFRNKNIDFQADEIKEILEVLHIDYLEQRIDKCSSGQKQKAAIACILLSDAPMIIMDEPFVAIDANSISSFINYLKKEKEKRLFLLTTHSIYKLATIVDRLVYLNQGCIQIDTIDKKDIKVFFQKSVEEDV